MKTTKSLLARVLPLLLIVPLGALPAEAAKAKCPGKTIVGNGKDNKIEGTCGPDKIYGLGGDDKLLGLGGGDKLFGGPGDDTLIGGAGGDTLNGEADDDTLRGNGGGDALKGGGGTDAVSYAGSPEGVKVSLHPEGKLPAGGHAKGDKLATIETLLGSSKGDKLESAGDYANPTTVAGLKGADKLTVHDPDTLDYTGSPAGVGIVLDDFEPESGGHAQGDVLFPATAYATILGSTHHDSFTGNQDPNEFHGEGGADQILGLGGFDMLYGDTSWNRPLHGVPGADELSGGSDSDFLEGGGGGDDILDSEGSNYLVYSSSPSGVNVDLTSTGAIVSGGDAEGDTVNGDFGWLYGSAHADTLIGTDASEIFVPVGGDDTIDGQGNSPLSLQPGFVEQGDRLYFLSMSSQAGGVVVDLAAGTSTGEGSDTISGIETVYGTEGPDSITGGPAREMIFSFWSVEGDVAIDSLAGGEGTDYLDGGVNDSYDGGTGNETATWEVLSTPGDGCFWSGDGTPEVLLNCENTNDNYQQWSSAAPRGRRPLVMSR